MQYIQIYLTFYHFHHLKEVSPRTLWPAPTQAGHFLFLLYSYHLGISVLGISFTSLLNPVSFSFLVHSSYVGKGTWEIKYLNVSKYLYFMLTLDTLSEYRNLVIFQQNCKMVLSSSFQCCSWEGPRYYESISILYVSPVFNSLEAFGNPLWNFTLMYVGMDLFLFIVLGAQWSLNQKSSLRLFLW